MSPVEEDGLREKAGRGTPRLPITELDLSLVERVRAAASVETIEDYVINLENLPPIRVALVDDRRVVVGGLHRVRAYERAGRLEIPCIIEPMTWTEAVRAAVADNRTHGLRMTRADKRAAIALLLAEDPDLSSRAIADLISCSPSTVGEVRTQLDNLPASPAEEEQVSKLDTSAAPGARARGPNHHATPRKGRDGKLYATPARPRIVPSLDTGRKHPMVQEEDPYPAAPQMAPALLIDYRAKAEWVAGYLHCVLRTAGDGHRAEALALLWHFGTAFEGIE
jgi:ParB-like nuclease domain